MHEKAVRDLWASVSDTAFPLADLRDEYLKLEGWRANLGRFGQLDDAYSNLNTIGDALFEYMNQKAPLFGRKPDREVVMIAQAAIQNGQILAEIARGELSLLRGSETK